MQLLTPKKLHLLSTPRRMYCVSMSSDKMIEMFVFDVDARIMTTSLFFDI